MENAPKIEITVRHTTDDKVIITSIKNALERNQYPKEYTEHVPYTHFMKYDNDGDEGYLFINYIGGLEHVEVGSTYPLERWAQILKYIDECEFKLYKITHGMVMDCPFCGRTDFNKASLKQHLLYRCDVWSKI